jgi:hypothetical protein
MTRTSGRFAFAFILATAASPAFAQGLELEAVAVNMSNVGPTGVGRLDITIDRWTSAEDLARLRDEVVEKGEDRVSRALQELRPVGRIRTTGRLGWDLRFAQQTVLSDGSRRIVFATDRPLSFREQMAGGITRDYDVIVGEIRIGPDGRGQGTVVPWGRVEYDPANATFFVENFASAPVRLTEVKIR